MNLIPLAADLLAREWWTEFTRAEAFMREERNGSKVLPTKSETTSESAMAGAGFQGLAVFALSRGVNRYDVTGILMSDAGSVSTASSPSIL